MGAVRIVGRYEILREIGRGGMAVVHLARQIELDRYVALKELAAFHATDPTSAQRFVRESLMAGSLSHPNVVTVHDFFEWDGTPMIAMEYVERGSLRPYIGRLSDAQAVGVLDGVLAGLAHAEQHGLVHRDIKPENLMVTGDGRIKITDFGIAKATGAATPMLTATGMAVGTPAYMAPEQATGREVGPWTDLYSLGCLAFELFCGRVPFDGADTPVALLHQHVNDAPPSPRSVRPDLDPRIAAWIERLLQKLPADRPPSAAEAREELDEIAIAMLGPRWRRDAPLSEREGGVTAPLRPAATATATAAPTSPSEPPPSEPSSPGRRRGRRTLVAAALVVAVAAVAVAVAVAGLGGEEAGASWSPPPANAKFDYQIGGAYPPPAGVRVVSRDWFSASPADGMYSICYVNAYQTQPDEEDVDRPDERSNWPAGLVLRRLGDDPGFAGESLVDISSATKRRQAADHLQPMIQTCADKGYKAVEYDNLDSWSASTAPRPRPACPSARRRPSPSRSFSPTARMPSVSRPDRRTRSRSRARSRARGSDSTSPSPSRAAASASARTTATSSAIASSTSSTAAPTSLARAGPSADA